VNNADSNEQFGADAEQRKSDVLRAKDIIPPLRAARPAPDLQQAGQEAPASPAVPPPSSDKGLSPGNVQLTQPEPNPAANTPTAPLKADQAKNEIPRFNLADKIMAEQRRITAVRRKGPGQTEEVQEQEQKAESVGGIKEQVPPALSEEEQIIADIVARDIEKLCRGRVSSVNE
jgi:hypothetical protein